MINIIVRCAKMKITKKLTTKIAIGGLTAAGITLIVLIVVQIVHFNAGLKELKGTVADLKAKNAVMQDNLDTIKKDFDETDALTLESLGGTIDYIGGMVKIHDDNVAVFNNNFDIVWKEFDYLEDQVSKLWVYKD